MSCITFTKLSIFIEFLLGLDLLFFFHTHYEGRYLYALADQIDIYFFIQTLKTPFNFETGIKLYPMLPPPFSLPVAFIAESFIDERKTFLDDMVEVGTDGRCSMF